MEKKSRVEKMRLKDKIALCSGADVWHSKAMPQYGIFSFMMADGPHGLRKQKNTADMLGINESVPATCFPTAVTTACSWDEDLLFQVGEAIAMEAKVNQVSVVLGPGANIKRNPLCGRNFEYFSEDPYLTGKMAAAFIRGAEDTGIGTSLKHFAMNNQEYKRFCSDSIVDERTMREIYLTGFEIAVKEGKPSTVMAAYNKVNGVHCTDSKELLNDILREEWGFDGLVVTDWAAMHDRIKGFQAGCDLVMPGGTAYMEAECADAVAKGTLAETDIDRCAERVVRLSGKTKQIQNTQDVSVEKLLEKNHELARRAAAESAVLLKNKDEILPLKKSDHVVFIGHMAKEIRYQGAGSSHINPWKLTSVTESCPGVTFVKGCQADGSTTRILLQEAADAASKAEKVVLFVGLPDSYESEGFDRDGMKMPKGHLRLIKAVTEVNSNVAVVMLSGSVVEVPWINRVKAVLYLGLPGQAGGEAIADLLYGKVNPSGRLAESWPIRYEDCVSSEYYGQKDAQYREGVYVGYRYYESAGKAVRFPFGYGLSYTEFEYSDLRFSGDGVSVTVVNTGNRTGKEVVQFYIEPVENGEYRPVRELKAFCKVELQPGESQKVYFKLNERSFAIWQDGWKVPKGKYRICIGRDSHSMILSQVVNMGTEECLCPDVPVWYWRPDGKPSKQEFEVLLGRRIEEKTLRKGDFTMENTILEMRDHSVIMKLLYHAVRLVVSAGYKGTKDEEDSTYRMLISTATDCSLSGIKMNGRMKNYVLEGLLEMANGHYLKGFKTMLKRVRG